MYGTNHGKLSNSVSRLSGEMFRPTKCVNKMLCVVLGERNTEEDDDSSDLTHGMNNIQSSLKLTNIASV